MRSESEVKIVLDVDEINKAKFPTTLIYGELLTAGVPIEWKGDGPPKDRDATVKDIKFNGEITVNRGTITARWS